MKSNSCLHWLKLNQDFFKERLTQNMLSQNRGHEMMCLYLQMLIHSSSTNGQIRVDIESQELSITEYLTCVLDSKKDIVEQLLLFLESNHAIGLISDKCIEIIEYKDCLKSGSESLHRVRKYRSIKQKKHCNVTENECNVTENECNVTENECNVTENECNVTENECNVTENECNVTSQQCNVTDGENAVNIELLEANHTIQENKPFLQNCNVTSQNCNVTEEQCNVTETSNSQIPIIEVIYETPNEEHDR